MKFQSASTQEYAIKQNSDANTIIQQEQPPPDVNNPPFFMPLKHFVDNYKCISELGTGSFGSVTLAKSVHNVDEFPYFEDTMLDHSEKYLPNYQHENYYNRKIGLVAIKTMMTKLNTLQDYTRVREIKFIFKLPSHRNLMSIFEVFIDDQSYKLHIVMEYMDQNLYQLMKARKHRLFSLPTLKSILSQILAGIHHIHKYEFFHRDIKPENILVSCSPKYYSKEWLFKNPVQENYIVKIADYGLAREIHNRNQYTTYVSTRWYRSPEILLRKNVYGKPVDIWAFGCVIVEVVTLKPLFPGSDELDQTWRILEVLGTPFLTMKNKENHYFPHGGIWEEASLLLAKLGLKFPYVEGIDIEKKIGNNILQDLCDVVKKCLTWNPDIRATVEELCCSPYFRNTVAQKEHLEHLHSTTYAQDIIVINNSEKSSKFAGLEITNTVNSKGTRAKKNGLQPTGPIQFLPTCTNLMKGIVNTRNATAQMNMDNDENIIQKINGNPNNYPMQNSAYETPSKVVLNTNDVLIQNICCGNNSNSNISMGDDFVTTPSRSSKCLEKNSSNVKHNQLSLQEMLQEVIGSEKQSKSYKHIPSRGKKDCSNFYDLENFSINPEGDEIDREDSKSFEEDVIDESIETSRQINRLLEENSGNNTIGGTYNNQDVSESYDVDSEGKKDEDISMKQAFKDSDEVIGNVLNLNKDDGNTIAKAQLEKEHFYDVGSDSDDSFINVYSELCNTIDDNKGSTELSATNNDSNYIYDHNINMGSEAKKQTTIHVPLMLDFFKYNNSDDKSGSGYTNDNNGVDNNTMNDGDISIRDIMNKSTTINSKNNPRLAGISSSRRNNITMMKVYD
ncbi:uncharacterized protein SCODWIG_03657 [Saccharomycodes ludwigii]|uniref:Protein kinase domain-containing protein n=1 Tax=Saccharomycodes ludwigii TaxID=36035 RepID=A0A376BBB0_9ASCO|nr:uncharacterized protein SCODWIG_03657 [Saccharomycodes ludwigii]